MVNINKQQKKIAIVGININCGSQTDLDKFERAIYEGKQYNHVLTHPDIKLNEILNQIVKEAVVKANAKIALIFVNEQDDKTSLPPTELSNFHVTHKLKSKTVFSGIEIAQKLLTLREVDAVLICEALSGAIVLKLEVDARKTNQAIYAVIDGLAVSQNSSTTANNITQTCRQAFNIAGVQPEDIDYLEICGSGILEPNELEIKSLVTAYQIKSNTEFHCAIGSVKANTGNSTASEIISIIKTVLCLYYRYIPAVPEWSNPKNIDLWKNSSFYVVTQSKPWYLAAQASKRIGAINSFSNGTCAHIILSEAPSQKRDSRYLTQMSYYLFPLAADDLNGLIEQIKALETTILQSDSLSDSAVKTFATYQKHQNATYAVAILGRNLKELQRETQRAIKGIKQAFETRGEWKTPVGSYFSAKPLGKKGKVAFVYPGGYSSYIGMAPNLFRLFPEIWDFPLIQSAYNRIASIEKFLYPRSLKVLTKRQLEALESEVMSDALFMLEVEIAFAILMSAVLKDYFKLQPQSCFGYSVGETSMAFAQGIWGNFSEASKAFNSSNLFSSRLSGSKDAVREYWGLSKEQNLGEFWRNYLLMADVSQVKEAIKNEQRVYLTQINTPNEIVIAGEPAACERVINNIGCNAIPAPFNHVIHCEAMASEFAELARLNTLPIQNKPDIEFYSAADYEALELDSVTLGKSIAKNLSQQLDFSRLVNRVYASGARIFVEVGAGNTCSRWIAQNLKEKEHTTVFFNRRGVPEHTTLIRALAQLISHRVEIDLSPLYNSNSALESQCKTFIQGNLSKSEQPVKISELKNKTTSENKHRIVTIFPSYSSYFSNQLFQKVENNYNNNLDVLDIGNNSNIAFDEAGIKNKLLTLNQPCYVVKIKDEIGFTNQFNASEQIKIITALPPLTPQQLGDRNFLEFHKVKYPYTAGAMAGGIASEELVIAFGKAGILSSFGAGGLSRERVKSAIKQIQQVLPNGLYAFNLLHNFSEPEMERDMVDLYLQYGVKTVEASAFLDITPNIVYYRAAGLSLNSNNQIEINNKVIAKVSRREVASKFMAPAPIKMLQELVEKGLISELQKELAQKVPIADDITVESDSGGHTDNRPLLCLLPAIFELRDEIQRKYRYQSPVRIGAAGGISTPQSALAAFMMGAAYVVTGSINQSCVEAGTSDYTKKLLAQAQMTDVIMAPAADMFEMGVKLQVLKRGTLFGMRSQKLYELYQRYDSIEDIPVLEREKLEKQIFKQSLDEIWSSTQTYLAQRNPEKLERANKNAKLKMALIFRWYLGLSSRWSNTGEKGREIDYQIWCGPAMGAFNNWVKDTYLAQPQNRNVVDIAQHILTGAAYLYRLQTLKLQGVELPASFAYYHPS